MTKSVLDLIEERSEEIAAEGAANEELGRLTDRSAELLREVGVIKMLQPAKYGGHEAHPADFAKAVMRLASLDGATGWVSGIVGVHPWEMAMCDSRVQEEVWGESHETWIASPYAPHGRAATGRGRLHLQRALAVLVGHRPLRLDLPRRLPR